MLDKNLLPDINANAVPNQQLVDHIPIACHYDADTLLTKNGELIQIIEVTGNEENSLGQPQKDIRTQIREAIINNIPDVNYAVNIHNIRSRKNIMPLGVEPFGLADELNKKWCRKNNWDKQLVNTIYISVTIQPKMKKKPMFLQLMSATSYKKAFHAGLADSIAQLNDTVGKVLSGLAGSGARKLTVLKTPDGYISEQLEFYYCLIHLNRRRTPMPVRDLSEFLSATEINFYFNTIEVINDDEVDYAAIYTVKPTSELSLEKLNNLLQTGSQFIISQVLYFVSALEAKQKFQKNYDFLKLSLSKTSIEKSGLESFMQADKGKITDYCLQQTTIMVHSDDIEFFMQKINSVNSILRDLGLVVVREDFFMPKLYWGQLPGNFRYLEKARMEYMPGKRIGDFCSMQHHLAGNHNGSKWGPPISLLRSFEGTPFFFNFHDSKGNGNMLIIGPANSGKTILKNFFVAQSVKLNPRIIYIDFEGYAREFIEAIGGDYHAVTHGHGLPLRINPFNPRLYGNDVNLFKQWLISAIMPGAGKIPKYDEFFTVLATKLFENNDVKDKIAMIKEILVATADQALLDGFDKLLGNEVFSNLFTQGEGVFGIFDINNIIGLNLTGLAKNEQLINIYLGLLLVSAIDTLDGKPTIIIFNKLNKIYEMDYFSPLFGKWLQALSDRNSIALCSDTHSERLDKNQRFIDDMDLFGTKLFLSDRFADKYFRKAFKLTEAEQFKIKSYAPDRKMFLLKQDKVSIMIALRLDGLEEEMKLLGKSEVRV